AARDQDERARRNQERLVRAVDDGDEDRRACGLERGPRLRAGVDAYACLLRRSAEPWSKGWPGEGARAGGERGRRATGEGEREDCGAHLGTTMHRACSGPAARLGLRAHHCRDFGRETSASSSSERPSAGTPRTSATIDAKSMSAAPMR